MPSVLDQFQSSADSRSGRAEGRSRYIFRYFNGHFAVTTPHLRETLAKDFPHFPLVRYPSENRPVSRGEETPQLALVRYPPAS